MSFDYWWNAHAADVLVDGYERTRNKAYIQQLDRLLNGMYKKNGNKWRNDYYDDMEWLALAMLRAYDVTRTPRYKALAEELWAMIKPGWTDVAGGGVMWMIRTPHSKNACSNGPAMIIAARMYRLNRQQEDLDFAKKIYAWELEHLVNPENGTVWDNMTEKDGVRKVNTTPRMVFTYNHGTWLGGALELYTLTKDRSYLEQALRTATFVVNDTARFSPDGILKGEGHGGDAGLFKGIFIRYFTQLILQCNLDASTKTHFVQYLRNNGKSLLGKGIKRPEYLFETTWRQQPPGAQQDASIQLSGIMLFEALCRLDKKSL